MTPDATPQSKQELAPQSTFGPYRITRLLGRGGMGAVYEAQHEADGRVVALKLLTVDLDKMDARERFMREGRTAAAINHPNAVYIYGTEEIDGTPAITMELVPGGTLDEKIKERGPLPWAEAVDDILQVIDGLDAAHSAGVLHRDVKPSNCFVGPGGAVKIGDFGLSKPVDGGDQLRLTQTGLFLGTPVFSSPEQLLGESIDVRSDIYAVGVTFYQLLTGALPYQSGSMMQVVASVLNGVPAPLTNFRQDLPQPVIDVVMKAMARQASDRYQTYAEFRTAVAALRVVEQDAATLWDRFRATVLDWGVNVLLLAIIGSIFMTDVLSTGGRRSDWRQVLASLVLTFLIVGIPEALRGASIGKWIIGIRVIGPDRAPPGFLREFGRLMILASIDLATLAVQMAVVDQTKKAGATLLTTFALRALLLTTARRHNGWRLVHDFATGTRVVRPRVDSELRRGESARAAAPPLAGNERRIGPYAVIGEASVGNGVLHGWDPAMRRAVWIVPKPAGEPETTEARRTLSRLSRLRWVGGRRAGEDSWDAFEAPVGEPLASRLKRPVSWSVQQNWLLDISSELLAAQEEGDSLAYASANALWVTPADRLVILEGASRGANQVGKPASLIAELSEAIRTARVAREPLPRYAMRALSTAGADATAAEVRTLVTATLGRPLSVTRARRFGMTFAVVAPIVAASVISWLSTSQSMRVDRQGFLLATLLSFVADSASSNADSVRAREAADRSNTARTRRFALAFESLGLVPVSVPDTITPADTLRRRRKLAEVYMVTALAVRARDSVTQSMFGNTQREQRLRKTIIERNRVIDSADARAARVLVDSVWNGAVPGIAPGNIPKYIPFVLTCSALLFAGACSLLLGLLIRRGPILRGFQLDVVTRDGLPAGRLRLLLRNILVWSVLLVPLPVILLAPRMSVETLATTIAATALLFLLVWALALYVAFRTPSRGVPERVSGTWLVPD